MRAAKVKVAGHATYTGYAGDTRRYLFTVWAWWCPPCAYGNVPGYGWRETYDAALAHARSHA